MKECKKCHVSKPYSEFYTDAARSYGDGLYPWCKPCKKGYLKGRYLESYGRLYEKSKRLIARYGMTWEEVVSKYGEDCNICGATSKGYMSRLAVDHDHKTGAIRGVLCARCNIGISHFEDSPQRLAAAIRYLAPERHTNVSRS